MEGKEWTKRGKMLDIDRKVIMSLVEKDKIASRIFVTGEVHQYYVGEAAQNMLLGINSVYYTGGLSEEPLFVETMDDTVRMTRFDPRFVWGCIKPETLVELITEETKRVGVPFDPWKMDNFDFYEEMVEYLKFTKGDFIIPVPKKGADVTAHYNNVYLSCLLLFGKPGYMDVPVWQHFAEQSAEAQLRYAEYRKLNPVEQTEAVKLREQYEHIQVLTSPEVKFIISLYKGGEDTRAEDSI